MQSQYDPQTTDESLAGYGEIVADEYLRQQQEHSETPDITPAPALWDIIDAQATVAGVQANDRALLAAVGAAFNRRAVTMPDLAAEA